MTTLDDVRVVATTSSRYASAHILQAGIRDSAVRACYAEGNATLQQLATATGLSKARIHQIVGGK